MPPIIRDKEEDKGKENKEGEEQEEGEEERKDLVDLQRIYIYISVLLLLYCYSTVTPLVGRSPYYNLVVLVLLPTFSSIYPLG